ncbi:phosphoglycerate mutase-like protein [Penicillium macrosclerotiorum]|uniref:phosphoglycerate mutase-like protein n=1 Tax=Penicillium macrosclerotiorum TaxID=303699 RepID=UPI002548A36F|nr:phosphoglycerate mutase-like protein [Penicillium macrosclerotiorum]KAJ5679499.1 phosphoglycerate mutase-like protein [Penicillium macrosclerotiorum]
MPSFANTAVSSLLFAVAADCTKVLAPANDILFPSSSSAQNPLQYAGGNSPYFAGPNVNGVENTVPDKCTVQQAAYVVRHGSRFPDTGSYNSWVGIQEKIQIAVEGKGFDARGSMSFISDWSPVLTNPTLQIAQESMTGWKEASDLGYQLRARYPDFYEDGNPFYVWANQYKYPINESRVVQTARAFVNGYLYEYADTYGTVVSVNSTGSVNAIGNSLGPSDTCPTFSSTSSGGSNVTDFDATWTPKALKRINSLVSGNLTFSETDILFFPYLCGYESQITGRLSPWCGVFTDEELRNYAYSQDLSYYYTVGPGSDGPASKLFLPFLESLLTLLSKGPGQTGTAADGGSFTVPDLIMAFLNDNQIAEMTAAMGIFDNEAALPDTRIPANHLYNIAHFITMRGTVAFEALNCEVGSGRHTANETYIRVLFNDAVYPIANCHSGPGKSCLLSDYLALIQKKSKAAGNWIDYCNVTETGHPTTVAGASFFSDLSLDFLTFVKP